MNNKSLEGRLWSAAPYVMTVVSLVGFLLVLVNPYCWFSPGKGECSWFAPTNAWGPYAGMGAGLQFFATGFLAAAVAFSWPALRSQISCLRGTLGEELLKICLILGYYALLLGIWIDMYGDNSAFAIKIATVFATSTALGGWVLIIVAGWNIIRAMRRAKSWLYKKLKKSSLYRALMSRCVFVRRLGRKKPP